MDAGKRPVFQSVDQASVSGARASERWVALDWLRVLAMFLVVVFHAGIPYVTHRLPKLLWPVHDAKPSAIADAMVWWIDGFAMPLFFFLGGFCAWKLMQRDGTSHFLRHRVRSLLKPFGYACLFIMPCVFLIWGLGFAVEGRIAFRIMFYPRAMAKLVPGLWGVAHLWFLQQLFVMSVVGWGVMHFSKGLKGSRLQEKIGGVGNWLASSTWRLLLLVVPSAVVLYFRPEILIGFRHTWYPLLANFLFFAPFYLGGFLLARQVEARSICTKWSLPQFASSLMLFPVTLGLIHRHLEMGLSAAGQGLMVTLFTASAWLSVCGLMGLSVRYLNTQNRWVTWLSVASMWVYLVHHPVVGLAQVVLDGVAIPVMLKYLIVVGTGMSFSLLTFSLRQSLAAARRSRTRLAAVPSHFERRGEPAISVATIQLRDAA